MKTLHPIRGWFRPPLACIAVLTVGLAAAPPVAARQVKTVPDVGVDGTATVDDIADKITEDWGPYQVVMLVDRARAGQLTVDEQWPEAGTKLTQGQYMHLLVSDTDDPFLGTPAEQSVVIVLIIVIIVLGWNLYKKPKRIPS